jgi:hypothetical protein
MNWEIFLDPSYYNMWCVRPIGDKDLNSPNLFIFALKDDAQKFKELAEKATFASPKTNQRAIDRCNGCASETCMERGTVEVCKSWHPGN